MGIEACPSPLRGFFAFLPIRMSYHDAPLLRCHGAGRAGVTLNPLTPAPNLDGGAVLESRETFRAAGVRLSLDLVG